MKYYCGIDPGYSNGAICLLREDLKEVIFHDITDEQPDGLLWHYPLVQFFKKYKLVIKYSAVERVHTSPMMGVVSAGKFYGSWMVLEVLTDLTDSPWVSVLPSKWQESLGISVDKEELDINDSPSVRSKKRSANKKNLKQSIFYWARAKFPEAELRTFTKDSNRADALGIAWYASRDHISGNRNPYTKAEL